MLKMKEPSLKNLENSAQIFNSLSDIPGDIEDVDVLFEISTDVGGVSLITVVRRFYYVLKQMCCFSLHSH